jgi:hypothetical protein
MKIFKEMHILVHNQNFKNRKKSRIPKSPNQSLPLYRIFEEKKLPNLSLSSHRIVQCILKINVKHFSYYFKERTSAASWPW